MPLKLNVCVNVTAVPFGTTMIPADDGLPVFVYEIQLEPGSGAAQAGFGEIALLRLARLNSSSR